MAVRCETHGLFIQGTMRREKRKILNYMTAKIMCLARQSRWYGHGGKNPYFEYAEIELRHIINAVADLRGRTRVGLIIARQHRKWFEDEEKQEQKTYVCGISEKQAFRIAEEMYNNDIQFMTALEIEKMNAEQPEEDEEDGDDSYDDSYDYIAAY